MANKKTKLSRSIAIHFGLSKKHSKKSSVDMLSMIKRTYHDDVAFEQAEKGRILSKQERKKIYGRVDSFYQKRKKQGKTIREINYAYMKKYYSPF